MSNNLTNELIQWYQRVKRDLPWRKTKDPYAIWISEVILQQTRVAQGLPYYYRFIESFPKVTDLAAAKEDEVLRLWEGLGYYSRARNLHAGAKYIAQDLEGRFPETYHDLLKVKGIGPYTAAAIASICFDLPAPVIDGNVYRVVARLYGIYEDIANASNRKHFLKILEEIIDHRQPGLFNQGMMELGATICIPGTPDCPSCPISDHCFARKNKVQKELPVKINKTKVRNRYFHYLIMQFEDRIAMQKRPAGDVWQGLYEFYLEETDEKAQPVFLNLIEKNEPFKTSETYKHVLSHQRIFARFYHLETKSDKTFEKMLDSLSMKSYSLADVVALPKPKLIVNYLTQLDK